MNKDSKYLDMIDIIEGGVEIVKYEDTPRQRAMNEIIFKVALHDFDGELTQKQRIDLIFKEPS